MSLGYMLTEIQEIAFVDRVDIYRMVGKVSFAPDIVTETIPTAPVSPSFRNVPCRIQAAKEGSVPLDMGRSNYDVMDTTDVIRFHSAQEVGDGDYLRLKTPGHPEKGTWYEAQGEAEFKQWQGKEQKLLLKKVTAPPFTPEGD